MTSLAIISEETVRKIVSRQLAFDAVRAAFESVAVDRARVFDVVIGTGLNDDEITVFDSSGIAIQDLMAAAAVFEAAKEMDQVQYIDF